MKDAITIIKADHRKLEKLFEAYEKLGNKAYKTKEAQALEIIRLLTIHTGMEEDLLYSRLSERLKKDDIKMVDEAYVEHGVAKELMSAIESMSPEQKLFDAKVKVLSEVVAHHVKDEENELLPTTKKEFSEEELIGIALKMEEYKKENEE